MKRLWFIIGVACRTFLVLFAFLVIGLCFLPYSLSWPIEFVDLSGPQARAWMSWRWPESIEPTDVDTVSARIYSQIDSYVGWYRIKATSEIAAKWQDVMHAELEESSQSGQGIEMVEGVHRIVISPVLPLPPLAVGDDVRMPNWWTPSPNEFRVTERMRWYKTLYSGYGDAVYSTFDPATKTLWVYAQSRQHCLLWEPGKVPAGNPFVKRIEKGGVPVVEPRPEVVD